MNILFIAATGVFQAVIAANLYMHTLHTEDYRQLPGFADYGLEQCGKPFCLGNDAGGNRIYALGVGPDVGMVKKCIEQLRSILAAGPNELQIIPIELKSQQLIIILQQISRLRVLRALSIDWVIKILRRELPFIQDQVSRIKITE